jgi:hypothetical protein
MITYDGTMYTCPKFHHHSVFISHLTAAARAIKIEDDITGTCHNCSMRLIPEEDLLREYFGLSLDSQAGGEADMHLSISKGDHRSLS